MIPDLKMAPRERNTDTVDFQKGFKFAMMEKKRLEKS
jgi:hypothetical protein